MSFFETWAPSSLAASWDNVGLQLGNPQQKISSVLIALEFDLFTLNFMKEKNVNLLITHHPLFFKFFKSLDYRSDMGQILNFSFQRQLALFSAHTNLDAAKGGVNDALIEHYGFEYQDFQPIKEGFGAYSSCNQDFDGLKQIMPCRVLGDQNMKKKVKKIAFCAGSGHGLVSILPRYDVDTFVTGEVTYHDHVFCEFHGIRIIAVGHYASEILVLPKIKSRLQQQFPLLNMETLSASRNDPECLVYI